jgi:hypothetical protein
MEDLVEKVNERFLRNILDAPDTMKLGALTSAYLDFAHAAKIMQDRELDLEDWLCGDECCQC